MPRKFEEGEILYDEEDEVPEIYFILEGSVGVGFRLGGVGRPFKLIKQMRDRTFICDFYVCNNKKSEFLYQATKEVKAFALQKKFIKKIFEKYPDIGNKIKGESYKRYKKMIKEPLVSQASNRSCVDQATRKGTRGAQQEERL